MHILKPTRLYLE